MISRRNKTLAIWAVFLAFWAWKVSAAAVKGETADVAVGELSIGDIEEQLQVCI
jgi:zinc transporter 7